MKFSRNKFSCQLPPSLKQRVLIRDTCALLLCALVACTSVTVRAQTETSSYHQQSTAPSPNIASPNAATNAYECTQVSIDDIDPSLLTKKERIALLDGSLDKSIDSYSTCIATVQQQSNGSSGGGAGNGAGLEGADTQSAASNESNEGLVSEEPVSTPVNLPNSKQISPAERGIIAPKDNDKIICKLLFEEIQTVTDSDMLKGLKQQYNNYNCGK